MELGKFGLVIKKNRRDFRDLLRSGHTMSFMGDKIKDYLKDCCSEFEEQTMIENLKEEFEEYLKEVKAA